MPEKRSNAQNREPGNTPPGSLGRKRNAYRRRHRKGFHAQCRYFGHRRIRIRWKRFLPMALFIALFLYCVIRLILFAVNSISTRRTNAELQMLYDSAKELIASEEPITEDLLLPIPTPIPTTTPAPVLLSSYQFIADTLLPGAQKLLSQNPDTVGWIKIPGVVNLPVVYRDNTYYLNHDFRQKHSNSGALFLDEAHPFASDTQYLVIHGHCMYDGSMFGLLSHYRKQGYMDKHPTVYFSTLYREEVYEVICVLRLSTDVQSENYLPYIGTRKFESMNQFNAFAQSIRDKALYWKEGAQMRPGDAFLALSTCDDDDRIVVMCRRVNP